MRVSVRLLACSKHALNALSSKAEESRGKKKRFLFSFLPFVMVHANVPRCSTAGCSFAPVLCIGCDSVVGVSLLVHEGESRAKKPKPLHKTCNERIFRRILSVLLSPHSPCTDTHSCALGGWGKGGLRNIIGTFAPSFSLFFASLYCLCPNVFKHAYPFAGREPIRLDQRGWMLQLIILHRQR